MYVDLPNRSAIKLTGIGDSEDRVCAKAIFRSFDVETTGRQRYQVIQATQAHLKSKEV